MVEINLEKDLDNVLVILFSLLTTFLISVHILALMISICVLPHLETVENMRNLEASRSGKKDGSAKMINAMIEESPHENLRRYIEIAWIFSTGLGTLLFLLEIPVLLWVKLHIFHVKIRKIASAVMVPVCILFIVFAIHFYRKIVDHKFTQSSREIEELELIANRLDTPSSTEDESKQSMLNDIKTV